MDKLKLQLLQEAFTRYGFINLCDGRTLEECFQPDRREEVMFFYFNLPSGTTKVVSRRINEGGA